MGGRNDKRRTLKRRTAKDVEVWAWKDDGGLVYLSLSRPIAHPTGGYWSTDDVGICNEVFDKLTGLSSLKQKDMPPTRIRIPAWTVLDK